MCRKDVCLKGDVQCLQLGAGTLDHRPIAVRTHDHCHFTNHFPKPLFLMSNKTDKQKRLRYTCTTAFISSFSVRAFCTRLHHAPDCSECDPIPCDPAPAASLKFPSAVSCASVFQAAMQARFLGHRPCTRYSLRQKNRFAKSVWANSPLCSHAVKKLSKVLCSFAILFLFKYDLCSGYILCKGCVDVSQIESQIFKK